MAIAKCEFSKYVLLWPIGRPNEPVFYFPSESVSWGSERIQMVLNPESAREVSFLRNLRPGTGDLVVSYGTSVILGVVLDLQHRMEKNSFVLTLRSSKTEFDVNLEAGFGDLGVDQLATMRARRLLLNDYPVRSSADLNEVTRDLFIGGQGTLLRISQSIFPGLFQTFGRDPVQFVNIAWIAAVTQLILSNCVERVETLVLEFVGVDLLVFFKGTRRKRFVNMPPFEIAISGICKLYPQDFDFPKQYASIDQLGPRLHGLSAKVSLVRATPDIAKRAMELISELESLLAALPPR